MEVQRPFFCDICGEAFTSRAYVKRHQAVHSANKDFKCELCSCQYKYKKGLNRHIKKWHRKLYSTNSSQPRDSLSPDANIAGSKTKLLSTDPSKSYILEFQAMQLQKFRDAGLSFFTTSLYPWFNFSY